MAGGYSVPTDGPLGQLIDTLAEHSRRLRELEAPTGTQTAQALAQIQALVDELAAEVAALAASGVTWAGPVTTTGTVQADAGITSLGAYNLDVTTLPGLRRGAWWHQSGAAGYAPSTRTRKENIRPANYTPEQFMQVAPQLFQYKAQADIRDNPNNPAHDPAYVVPVEVGLIAEDLIDAGLEAFVFTDDDGNPAGIDYATFGAIAALVLGQAAYTHATP